MKNAMIAICLFFALVSLCFGTAIDAYHPDTAIQVSRFDVSSLRLEISMAGVEYSSGGKVTLPPALASHAVLDAGLPRLLLHLALPGEGEYSLGYHAPRKETGITLPAAAQADTEAVAVGKPYWLRDIRGMDVVVSPFQVVAGKLMVCEYISIELTERDPAGTHSPENHPRKLNPYFTDIYRQHFLNFGCRYEDLAEYGSMAVICPNEYRGLIEPWVRWKIEKGIPTTVYSTDLTGHTFTEIKAFIQNLYQQDPNFAFVQLIGDYAQVPCLVTGSGSQHGGRDADYALIDADDWYPDIFVGRFSAETNADLQTQIQRSMWYEIELSSGAWLARAAGAASALPPTPGDNGEHNWDHLDVIRAKLLAYGYTSVDRVYANEGATTQDFAASFNEGISWLSFCGEGFQEYWNTPRFSVADAAALANASELPFIHSVACSVGQFYNGTCLAEVLLRARDAATQEPIGAIAMYAGAPHQGIAPPMRAQDHTIDLLLSGSKNTLGGLCYNGCNDMIDAYPQGGDANFWGWNLFGDASLMVRTKPAETINASLPDHLAPATASLTLQTGDPDILVGLSRNGQFIAAGFSGADGWANLNWDNGVAAGDALCLTLTGSDKTTIQHRFFCYAPGEVFLECGIAQPDIQLEPEVIVHRQVLLQNKTTVPAHNARAQLVSLSPCLGALSAEQTLGAIPPGGSAETTVSFIISRAAPDYTQAEYGIRVRADGFENTFRHSETVHSPNLVVLDIIRSPQANWVNAGDELCLTCKLKNTGSASIRDLSGSLSLPQGSGWEPGPQNWLDSIAPDGADSLVFQIHVGPDHHGDAAQVIQLELSSANAVGATLSQPWLLIGPSQVMDSFETSGLAAFPWERVAAQWAIETGGVDGWHCAGAVPGSDGQASLRITFRLNDSGPAKFYYQLPACSAWRVFLNGDLAQTLAPSSAWQLSSIPLPEGANTIRWEGTGTIKLDAVQFPPTAMFESALLAAGPGHVTFELSPGEIRQLPLELSSCDGKYVEYKAVLLKQPSPSPKPGHPVLSCANASFTPGSQEFFVFGLANGVPATSITAVHIAPPQSAVALLASQFVQAGQTGLPFCGGTGSSGELVWQAQPGTSADSLWAMVKFATTAGVSRLSFPYRLAFASREEVSGEIVVDAGAAAGECLRLGDNAGELVDTQTGRLVLTADQYLLNGASGSYSLAIYYNGSKLLNIPVSVNFDASTPGFYAEPRLDCFPNPAQAGTSFAFILPEGALTRLEVYNLRGQKVASLFSGFAAKGYYRQAWDLADENRRRVGSGIYFCRLQTETGITKTVKCMVLK